MPYIPRAIRPSAAPKRSEPLFTLADIDKLSGKPDPGPSAGSVEQLYMPGEALFGAVAVDMRARGWSVYPQERDDRRMPSMIDKRAIKIGKYFDKAPSPKETRRWSLQASAANAAILLGPVSGNVFCIDADLKDEDQSRTVQDLATKILGESPFQRVGTEPKIALFYRTADAADLPRNRAYRLEDSGDQIEILAKGKSITAYGQHHSTGRYFKWFGGKPPVVYGPEHAPLVTPGQLDEFIEAVREVYPFKSALVPVLSAAFDGVMDSVDGWAVPVVGAEIVDDAGRVKDGREPWLKRMTFELVRKNSHRVATFSEGTWTAHPAGISAAIEVLASVCRERMVLEGRFADGAPLRYEITDRIQRDIALLEAGGYTSLGSLRTTTGAVVTTRRFVDEAVETDPALWHLPARDKRKVLEFASHTMPDAVIAGARALRTDRTDVSVRVDAEIGVGLDAFFDRVYQSEEGERPQVHVLASPAGSGKTTKTLAKMAGDPRTYQYDELPRDERPGPLVFLLPTYNNISELRVRAEVMNLDPSLSDEDLVEQAAERGIMSVEDAKAEIERLRKTAKGTALKTMVYRGKVAAGCHESMVPKVEMLSAAGHGSAGLCHARVAEKQPLRTPKWTPREYTDQYCVHYSTCPAIAQRSKIADMHVVFLPHAFMSLSIPEELKNIRGVIADERVFQMFVHTTEFELASLRRERKEPRLTKLEDAAGLTPEDIKNQRDEAAWIAAKAMEAGKCPIAALAAFKDVRPKLTLTGLDLVKSAVRVCGGASAMDGIISPDISESELAIICEAPTGKDVREEWRFWSIIRDCLEGLTEGKPLPPKDRKIQLRRYDAHGVTHENIRISWTTTPNWPAAPVLLLDASAHEDIVRAVFPDRQVVMHRVEADMNCRIVAVVDKRYSQSSLVCPATAEPATRAACAANIESIRDRITFLSIVHGNGRIIACASRSVRRAIEANWTCPGNIDWIHFGAERGLNFAEKHVAGIIIGRMELPVWMYDGLACALARDTDPLSLLDPLGTGLDDAGERLRPTQDIVTIRRRDGADIGLLTARNPAGLLRVVQEQFREEGILQALCRVRPVYRTDTPTVYLFCQSIPESLIVDEVCSGGDLLPSYQPLLEACRMLGVIDDTIAAAWRDDIATPKQFRDMLLDMPKELKSRFSVVRWTPRGEIRPSAAAVSAWVANPVAFVNAILAWAGFEQDGAPELVRQAERVEPADVRPEDDLIRELGNREERREREWLGLAQASTRLSEQNLYVPASGRGRHPAGPGDLAQVRLWLSSHALVHGIVVPKPEVAAPVTLADEYRESEAIAL